MKEEPTNSKSIYNKTKLNKRLQFPYKLHVFNFSISECFDLQPKGSNGMLEKNGAHCHIRHKSFTRPIFCHLITAASI